MEKNDSERIKDSEAICTYFQILQDVITRMGSNSSNIKGLIAVIYTIFITVIIAVNKVKLYWWLGIIISIIGIIMDTYYLAIERLYRKKYNRFLKLINDNDFDEKDIFDMNYRVTDLRFEVLAEMLECLTSFSVWGYYLLYITLSIIFRFI